MSWPEPGLSMEEELIEIGGERRDAEAARSATIKSLRAAVRRAAAQGWSKTQIAKAAGVSRQTVYGMLKNDG